MIWYIIPGPVSGDKSFMSASHYLLQTITNRSAGGIASGIERAIRDGELSTGDAIPTVRNLAAALAVSPATVASAYRTLKTRGVIITDGRRGTRISNRLIHHQFVRPPIPDGVKNLCDGNPDRRLLPDMSPVLGRIDATALLYGEPTEDQNLVNIVKKDMKRDGVRVGEICVTQGALDGIERVLAEHLRPGDAVIVEDPGFGNTFDLVTVRGLRLTPAQVDAEGMIPDALERAIAGGAKALIVVPRSQNPTGACITESRAKALRQILTQNPELLLIEDDHANLITDAPLNCLHHAGVRNWVHIRSFSKGLNPDLRLAVMTGDAETINRVRSRLLVGGRWVSHVLQRIAAAMLADQSVNDALQRAAATYGVRRSALVKALEGEGIPVASSSGYNVWIPVREETPTVQQLLTTGWAVSSGERFRIQSAPAIRVTTATLEPEDAKRLASDIAAITTMSAGTPYA